MARSVETFELKDWMRWDHKFEDPAARADEAERRIRAVEVGRDEEGEGERELGVLDLNAAGGRVAREWLMERAQL